MGKHKQETHSIQTLQTRVEILKPLLKGYLAIGRVKNTGNQYPVNNTPATWLRGRGGGVGGCKKSSKICALVQSTLRILRASTPSLPAREGEGEEEKKKNNHENGEWDGSRAGFPSLLFTITKQNYTMRRILVVLRSCYRHVLAMERTVLPSSLSATFLIWNIGCVVATFGLNSNEK